MAGTYDATVNAFYLAYYGRPADPAGLAWWSQALAQNGGDFSNIIAAFSTSAEANARFDSTTTPDHIKGVYQQLFGRAPDQAGLDYWAKAIDHGDVTLADAAIQIMHGAQNSDAQVSTLRQQAAAQFTANVASAGVAYDGSAAIDAARMLIAAVKPGASADDVKALVAASASLVQTAHDNPAVIGALAKDGNLAALLDTAGGKAAPVALVQALASIGKAAAGDSTGLTALLHGDGIAGLLDTLPAGTTLQDVAKAVDQGGLAAGAAVIKPPAPAPAPLPAPAAPVDRTPPAAPKVQLVEDTGTSATDHLTRNGKLQVSGLEAGATWEYSSDGKTWHTGAAASKGVAFLETSTEGTHVLQVRSHDAAGNVSAATTFQYTLATTFTPTIAFADPAYGDLPASHLQTNEPRVDVNLHGGSNLASFVVEESGTSKDGDWTTIAPGTTLAEGTHYLRYVATDRAGNTAATNTLQVDVDRTAPAAPGVALVTDSGASATDHITNNGLIKVTGLEADAILEYSDDHGNTWSRVLGPDQTGADRTFAEIGNEGERVLMVRSIDAAGNVGASTTFHYTVETFLPVTLYAGHTDWGVTTTTPDLALSIPRPEWHPDDLITTYAVSTTGKEGDFTAWMPGQHLDDGTYYFRAHVEDPAGNVADTNTVTVHLDNVAPAVPAVRLSYDTGVDGDGITFAGSVVISGIEPGAEWDYSLDGGKTWIPSVLPAPGGTAYAIAEPGEQTMIVRARDAAGNVSAASTPLHFTYDPHTPAEGLVFDHIEGEAKGNTHTLQTHADVVFSYDGNIKDGETAEYTLDLQHWMPMPAASIDAHARTITLHDIDLASADASIRVRVSNASGLFSYASVDIDGPHTDFNALTWANGITVWRWQPAHLYLTDGSNVPVQVRSSDASGDAVANDSVVIGAQDTVVQGVLGAGPDSAHQTRNDSTVYLLGTNGADTLSGREVWGFDGDDIISTPASTTYYNVDVSGGAGADQIHADATLNTLLYGSTRDSFIAADDGTAHGFDTVYMGSDVMVTFDFQNVKLFAGSDRMTGTGYTGNETGNALLALLNRTVAPVFNAHGPQATIVDFGAGSNGDHVNFVVIDTDGDGTIGAADYAVKVVGTINAQSDFWLGEPNAIVTIHA